MAEIEIAYKTRVSKSDPLVEVRGRGLACDWCGALISILSEEEVQKQLEQAREVRLKADECSMFPDDSIPQRVEGQVTSDTILCRECIKKANHE